jgi:hypothetical protein
MESRISERVGYFLGRHGKQSWLESWPES